MDKGRRRIHGKDLPTPEQIRQDTGIPWQTIQVSASGQTRSLDVKTLERVRWRKAGALDLRLVVIRPVPCQGPGGQKAAPASAVAAYSMPHLAAAKEYGWTAKPNVIPLPKCMDTAVIRGLSRHAGRRPAVGRPGPGDSFSPPARSPR